MALPNFLPADGCKEFFAGCECWGQSFPPQDGLIVLFLFSVFRWLFYWFWGIQKHSETFSWLPNKVLATVLKHLHCNCVSSVSEKESFNFHGDISTFNSSPHANRSHEWFVFSLFASKQFKVLYTSRELWMGEDMLHKRVEWVSECKSGSLASLMLRTQRRSWEDTGPSKPITLMHWVLYTSSVTFYYDPIRW